MKNTSVILKNKHAIRDIKDRLIGIKWEKNKIDKLLRVVNINNPNTALLLNNIDTFDLKRLYELTTATGVQLDYTVLLPDKIEESEFINLTDTDINKLNQTVDILDKQFGKKGNYLSLMLKTITETVKKHKKNSKFKHSLLVIVCILLIVITIYYLGTY